MKQFTSISGFWAVQLVGADIPALLRRITDSGVSLYRIQQKDLLTVYVWVRRKDFQKLQSISQKLGAEVSAVSRTGFYWLWRSIIRRPVLIVGITLILLLSWFVPTRVLFVTVEGNAAIPENLIIEKAAECGIAFGAKRRDVRSEKMKNSLLEALPQLQWTGINTYGCTAVISVEERTKQEESSRSHGVSSIVAGRDGIIQSCTVTRGNQLCAEGQAVRAGETLVSGYSDCGIKIQATRAEAEIFAQTVRQLTVKFPLDYEQKGDIDRVEVKYSLVVGKKRINFSKYSGISPSVCDKMYSQYYCVLPGGFQLPVSIAVEQFIFRKSDTTTAASDQVKTRTEQFAQNYLMEQMLSGKILGCLENEDIGDAVYTFTGRYICLEMIGREQSEEIIKHHGKSD